MKVLVTGQTGQLARSLMALAPVSRHTLHAIGRPDLDIASLASVEAIFGSVQPDIVINAAAYTAVDNAERDAETAFAINEQGARHVASYCASAGVPLIHISTDYVFSGEKNAAYVETDATAPTGIYGQSKCEGERAVIETCPHHLILRTAWVHSPYGKNFVKTMLRLAETRDEVGVVADQFGSPTYAPHLAEALLRIVDVIAASRPDDVAWGVYHAAGSGSASWNEVAAETFRHAHRLGLPSSTVKPITTADYPTPAKRPQNSRLSCDKLDAAFAVRLPDWRDGVAACVERLAP